MCICIERCRILIRYVEFKELFRTIGDSVHAIKNFFFLFRNCYTSRCLLNQEDELCGSYYEKLRLGCGFFYFVCFFNDLHYALWSNSAAVHV